MSVQPYLDAVDHKVAEMFRQDYRTVRTAYDAIDTYPGLANTFLRFAIWADDRTILELADQYIATWIGDFDPDASTDEDWA